MSMRRPTLCLTLSFLFTTCASGNVILRVRTLPRNKIAKLAICSILSTFCFNLITQCMQTSNCTSDPLELEDMPANFGPRIPTEGIEGFLIVADPPTACSKLRVPVTPVVSWVALIQRSQEQDAECTFDMKVQNAQQAGAIAAIIYDDSFEPLIIMSKPLGHPDPAIPAIFVAQKTGLVMQKFLTTCTVTVQIIQVTDTVWVSMLMSALAGILAVCLMIATFYCIRRQRGFGPVGAAAYQALDGCADGMSAEQMRALPVVIAEKCRGRRAGSDGSTDDSETGSDEGSPVGPKGGGTLKTCAICIEDYRDGEKLRVLPCKHRFHTECIDQWLSSRKPLCPVCKHDALRPFGTEEAEAQAQEDAQVAGEDPRPEISLPPFFFPIRRWRRRWQWGPGPSHPQATTTALDTNALDTATAPVDIEQPALQSQEASQNDAGASSSSSHGGLVGNAPAVALGSTHFNFPGMHYSRSSRLSVVASSDDITPAHDTQGIRADRDALQQDASRTAAALPPLRTHSRRPGRAHFSRGLNGRSLLPDRPNPTDDMLTG